MQDFDDIDLKILELLVENSRRSFADIADSVGRSPPAVSDRIDRLEAAGIINQFTVDVDRSQLQGGVPVLIHIEPASDGCGIGELREQLLEIGAVEHLFQTAGADLVCFARVPDSDVTGWLSDTIDLDDLAEWEVTLCSGADWSPDLGATEFALTCVQCGNTVDDEGNVIRLDGDRYAFCCPSCEARFREQYERLKEEA